MEILADLGAVTVARATREHVPTIERLLADDPMSPRHVATTTLVSDEMLGHAPEGSDLAPVFDQIDADPHQLLGVVLDDGDRVIGTFQLTFVHTLARGGGGRAIVSGARIRAGSDSVAIGRSVFGWLIEYARSRQARVLLAITDKSRAHLHGFYTTMGFRASHEALVLPL